jgi:tRNA-specific 2-thiouridylase
MSGGVDSAVAAALMAEAGHEVTGITLKLWCYGTTPMSPRACCTLDAIDEARAVARRMGFAHYVVDAEEVFRQRVLQPFLDAYARGRTPYPCALCNQHLKFGDLLGRLDLIGAEVLVTGHYARIEPGADGSVELLRAADRAKDQSYALALVPRAALERAAFPLGAMTKDEARAHAARLELAVWDKPESQDLCFVPDGDYAGFAARTLGERRGTEPGPIEDAEGRRLGTHRGIFHYTVGQRRGLGLAVPEPLYVLAVEPERNTLVVGGRHALEAEGLVTEPMNWLVSDVPDATRSVSAKIRYQHAPAEARVASRPDGRVEVRFTSPQSAVTPGQSCVLYDGDRVLGGAPIAHALPRPGATAGALPARA